MIPLRESAREVFGELAWSKNRTVREKFLGGR
jgi:hypothetical protein